MGVAWRSSICVDLEKMYAAANAMALHKRNRKKNWVLEIRGQR